MKTESFAEILQSFNGGEPTAETVFHNSQTSEYQQFQGDLEPANMAQLFSYVSPVRVQNDLSSMTLLRAKNAYGLRPTTREFKLQQKHMTPEQFKAYETLFYILVNDYEMPILKAHVAFPEEFNLNQLKKTFRLAARKNHPDQGGSHERFLQIKKSYEILGGLVNTSPL